MSLFARLGRRNALQPRPSILEQPFGLLLAHIGGAVGTHRHYGSLSHVELRDTGYHVGRSLQAHLAAVRPRRNSRRQFAIVLDPSCGRSSALDPIESLRQRVDLVVMRAPIKPRDLAYELLEPMC